MRAAYASEIIITDEDGKEVAKLIHSVENVYNVVMSEDNYPTSDDLRYIADVVDSVLTEGLAEIEEGLEDEEQDWQ